MSENDLYCAIHNRDEPNGYYRCFECRHSWQTPVELVADEIDLAHSFKEIGVNYEPITNPDAITICPLCTHDF